MIIIHRPRLAGKTMELIRASAHYWHYIVCENMKEASRICNAAEQMGLKIPQPITYDEFINKRYHGRGIKGFLIDNVDLLLQVLSPGVPIAGISLTEPPKQGDLSFELRR